MTGAWGSSAQASVRLAAGDDSVMVKMSVAPGDIRLWWPAGMGAQPLYNVTAKFIPAAETAAVALQVSRDGISWSSYCIGVGLG